MNDDAETAKIKQKLKEWWEKSSKDEKVFKEIISGDLHLFSFTRREPKYNNKKLNYYYRNI
jgi:hypothetical protein